MILFLRYIQSMFKYFSLNYSLKLIYYDYICDNNVVACSLVQHFLNCPNDNEFEVVS